MGTKERSFIYRNSLSIVFLLMALTCLVGQAFTGLLQYNDFLKDHLQEPVTIFAYLVSGHFFQATFENWESEFFQMTLFVWFTVFLRQKGSSESKGFSEKEAVDRLPKSHRSAPWPVKKGGLILQLYKHSLSLSLLFLFLISFILHWWGSLKDYNIAQVLEGKPKETMWDFLASSKFWFESFQNWQSEFLSIFAIIYLSIFLREIGSPQSKPVDAPHWETGE